MAQLQLSPYTDAKRIAIFDFDSTLSSDEISFIDRASMVDRGFGGSERVEMLAAMLFGLNKRDVALAICSLNSAAAGRSGSMESRGMRHRNTWLLKRNNTRTTVSPPLAPPHKVYSRTCKLS